MPTNLMHRPSVPPPRSRRSWLLPTLVILPVVAILATAVVLTHSPVREGPAAAPRSHDVRYEVTGVPGSRFEISYVQDGSESKVFDQPVPWTVHTTAQPTGAPYVELTVTAVRGATATPPTTATTDCKIIADGRVVAENHTSAQSAFVDCDAVVS